MRSVAGVEFVSARKRAMACYARCMCDMLAQMYRPLICLLSIEVIWGVISIQRLLRKRVNVIQDKASSGFMSQFTPEEVCLRSRTRTDPSTRTDLGRRQPLAAKLMHAGHDPIPAFALA